MPGLFLPTNYKQQVAKPITLKHEATGRETVLLIPGAESMDISQLREIIQWQTEKFEAESKAAGPKPQRIYSKKEVGKALREFREYALRRQGTSRNRIYH